MGTDIHAFVEYAHFDDGRSFSGTPESPARLLGSFNLLSDYDLFNALGDGRNSLMSPGDIAKRALFPPRGVPSDISLPVAREYYDLIVGRDLPSRWFWPRHGCVSLEEVRPRLKEGVTLYGTPIGRGTVVDGTRSWRVVAKAHWHTPSWLTLQEIRQSLDHHGLAEAQLRWDFRALMTCLAEAQGNGNRQVRLVFWFDTERDAVFGSADNGVVDRQTACSGSIQKHPDAAYEQKRRQNIAQHHRRQMLYAQPGTNDGARGDGRKPRRQSRRPDLRRAPQPCERGC